MGFFRVYVKPFDEEGNYTDWIDVSQYVDKNSLSDLTQQIDGNSDYQLGVFTFSNVNIKFNNRTGKFSDVETIQSLFRYKRADTQIKLTWRIQDGPYCGLAVSGVDYLSDEVEIFKGLLNDESCATDAQTQFLSMTVLGFESLFVRTIVPFDTVDSGDPISQNLYDILNQPQITQLLNLDIANLVPGLNQLTDSLASLQNKTVKEVLDNLLPASNSVLYIKDDTIFVKDRSPTPDIKFTFFGQASKLGVENVLDINQIKNGVARVVNYATWSDSALVVTDDESVTRNGIQKRESNYDFFTDATKRENLLTAIVTDFSTAKQEFDLYCELNYKTLVLGILDRVVLDYPTVYLPGEEAIPICGIAEWGEDDGTPAGFLLPEALWSFQVSTDEPYKILSKKVSVKSQTITFHLRKI